MTFSNDVPIQLFSANLCLILCCCLSIMHNGSTWTKKKKNSQINWTLSQCIPLKLVSRKFEMTARSCFDVHIFNVLYFAKCETPVCYYSFVILMPDKVTKYCFLFMTWYFIIHVKILKSKLSLQLND